MDKTVIIIGGGFGGLNAAKGLARRKGLRVLLFDRRNHHLFQPLLYQVATAGLNPGDIAVPIRSQFSSDPNIEVHLAHIDRVDLKSRTVHAGEAEFKYDYLIMACGANHSYFAHPEWEEFAPGLKSLEQATEMRRRLLSAFEQAENESDPATQQALLTFVVVGGGPTGVELAGAIADISHTVLHNDFRRIDPHRARVLLIEAGSRVLAAFSESTSTRAAHDLKILGVEVRTGERVEAIDPEGVTVAGHRIPARTVFWAAGVQAVRIAGVASETDRAGRLIVGSDFALPGYPEVFAIGDMAGFKTEKGEWLPGLAPVAIQAGHYLARMIRDELAGRPRTPFHYVDKGIMATIGKNRAVLEAGNLKMRGRLAWWAWLVVHIFFLIGFKNRVAVMAQWAWSYIFAKRGARLITERSWRLPKSDGPANTPPAPASGSLNK